MLKQDAPSDEHVFSYARTGFAIRLRAKGVHEMDIMTSWGSYDLADDVSLHSRGAAEFTRGSRCAQQAAVTVSSATSGKQKRAKIAPSGDRDRWSLGGRRRRRTTTTKVSCRTFVAGHTGQSSQLFPVTPGRYAQFLATDESTQGGAARDALSTMSQVQRSTTRQNDTSRKSLLTGGPKFGTLTLWPQPFDDKPSRRWAVFLCLFIMELWIVFT